MQTANCYLCKQNSASFDIREKAFNNCTNIKKVYFYGKDYLDWNIVGGHYAIDYLNDKVSITYCKR